jgi:hypothetical protein
MQVSAPDLCKAFRPLDVVAHGLAADAGHVPLNLEHLAVYADRVIAFWHLTL